ncbi:hypothetical protein CEXT_187391 [Caerostris extrusa]|uniref:Uncharacterized protein n=1 Tax=Caerostris extrusa TaxID=172846 RepID=A0AAV4VRY2_CAEEX|nr:hypothetical protein CEXT_187391 [Caerostris extrusa]
MNEVVVAEKRIIFRHIYVRDIVPIVWNDKIDKISCPHIFFLGREKSLSILVHVYPQTRHLSCLYGDILLLPRRVFGDVLVVPFVELDLFWEVSVHPCPRMSPDKAFVMLVCDILLPRRVFGDAFVVSFMELDLFW